MPATKVTVPAFMMPIYRFMNGRGELLFGETGRCATLWELILCDGHNDNYKFAFGSVVISMADLKAQAALVAREGSAGNELLRTVLDGLVVPVGLKSAEKRAIFEMLINVEPRSIGFIEKCQALSRSESLEDASASRLVRQLSNG